MIRPVRSVIAATLSLAFAAAAPPPDLARAWSVYDAGHYPQARDLALAYLASHGPDYSAAFLAAIAGCRSHMHRVANAGPLRQLRIDYSPGGDQQVEIGQWLEFCTSPPMAGLDGAALSSTPGVSYGRPSDRQPPPRHPRPAPPASPPPAPPRVVAQALVVQGPASVKPAVCRSLDYQVARATPSNAATIATLRTSCARALAPPASPGIGAAPPPPAPDAALPPEVEAANAERRRRYLAAVCREPYVWRNAFRGDRVCVEPQVRDDAAADNARAAERRNPTGPYGPMSCIQGYVWRAARDGDTVCVVPQRRDQAAGDNAAAASRLAGGVAASG